ncbi:HAD family hydrolase [Butyricicoccus sp.]|uniref:HAD family hydrolase n=1 Tax=Butyricicoccus sp. TaxID=2049021 RepID=UPI003F16E695
MKAGAIFDMDGTLLDTERLYRETWEELAVEYGREPDPQFPRAVAGTSGDHMLDIIEQYYPGLDTQAFRQDCLDRVKEKVAQQVPPKPGMEQLLSYLHQKGVKLAVASSNSVEQIEKNLCLCGALPYFDAIAGGDEVIYGKPAPDIFLLAAERLGIPPRNCYVFEDGINGVRAGVGAGCTTVMIPDGNLPTEEMYRICAGVYDTLLDVRAALEQGDI